MRIIKGRKEGRKGNCADHRPRGNCLCLLKQVNRGNDISDGKTRTKT
jgi:hypothetical protein